MTTEDGNTELPSELLTARDVAHLLGVYPNTVTKWNDQGLLKAYRIGESGDPRFTLDDVLQFLIDEELGGNPAAG